MNDRDPSETPFEERTRAAFDATVANLDGRTRSRLNQARQQAVAIAANPARQKWMRALVPATGLATAALVAVMLQFNAPGHNSRSSETLALEDLEIVSDSDNLDLMQDIDFYAWMPQGDASNQ
ncbi:MAG TPA: hypothetical protein VFS24_12285 [Steroidobacteraceae bacterium]|nr:hypothetical protein [Steroidobacteraceae bacterium]